MIEVLSLTQWRVTPLPASLAIKRLTDIGLDPVVVSVDGNVLTLHPGASPGTTYELGGETVLVPPSLVPAPTPEPDTGAAPVDVVLATIGRVMHRAAGTPATRLWQARNPGAGRLVVESTLGFPDAGAVFVGDVRFTYTGRTSGSFEGAVPEPSPAYQLGRGTLVLLDSLSAHASEGGTTWPPPPPPPVEDWWVDDAYLEF